jgi:Putative binding domain, N-terminal/Viral BACON domain
VKRYCWLLVAIVVMLDVRAAQAQCTSSVTPTSVSVSSIGSTSALSVVSGTNCTWTAVSMVPWITVNSATGHGIGQVNYTVAANTTGVVRIGTMTVAGQTVTFTQAANSCTYSVTPTSVSVAAIGGPSGLSVTAGTSCSWTATSNVAWITITSGASGSGIGGVNYTVATNTGAVRTGTLTVAGKTVTFSQAAGSGATPPPPPTNLRIVG